MWLQSLDGQYASRAWTTRDLIFFKRSVIPCFKLSVIFQEKLSFLTFNSCSHRSRR